MCVHRVTGLCCYTNARESPNLDRNNRQRRGDADHAFHCIPVARQPVVDPRPFLVVALRALKQGVPSWWYTHVGTKVLIDGRGRGHLIIDPSFVEKRFFVRSKRYVLSHLIEAYQAGLRGNLLQVNYVIAVLLSFLLLLLLLRSVLLMLFQSRRRCNRCSVILS